MTFRCKMCGGAMEVSENERVATCEYCGTRQTLPRISSEAKGALYDQAESLRSANDFERAYSLYGQIATMDEDDAEAYWGLVLCTYGIEYVEDPESHKRVPTVNRTQYQSILDNPNYQKALSLADGLQREVYEQEARKIDQIQQGILAISRGEEPFDVFICYKETDSDGRRTRDSVIAQELYYGLVKAGFKVFFSRITLESKAGIAYEPYIFAALHSAKVMVVLGTKREYFNAVWVKNEWGRYLSLMRQDSQKHLIPAYRDMDPYDLPGEFSYLQAMDMSRLGFMQDMILGITKLIGKRKQEETDSSPRVSPISHPDYVTRGFKALKIGRNEFAFQMFKHSMDEEVDNPWGYLGAFCAYYKQHGGKVSSAEDLYDLPDSEILRNDPEGYYKMAQSLADDDFQKNFLAKRASRQQELKERFFEETRQRIAQTEDPVSMNSLIKELKKEPADSFPSESSLPTLLLEATRKRFQLIFKTDGPTDDFLNEMAAFVLNNPDEKETKELLGTSLVEHFEKLLSSEEDLKQCGKSLYVLKKYATLFPESYDVGSLREAYEKKLTDLQLGERYKDAEYFFSITYYGEAKNRFEALGQFRDAPQRAKECKDILSEAIYKAARKDEVLCKYGEAIKKYKTVADWKDSAARIKSCKIKNFVALVILSLFFVFLFGMIGNNIFWCKSPEGHRRPLSRTLKTHEYSARMACTVCGYEMPFEEIEKLPDAQYFAYCVEMQGTNGHYKYLLARCYLEGRGTSVDYCKAYELLRDGDRQWSTESGDLLDQYRIAGVLSVDELHWTPEHGPYYVTNSVYVNPGNTLVIDPGTQVIFTGGYHIFIRKGAYLRAEGTEDKPINFLPLSGESSAANYTIACDNEKQLVLAHTNIPLNKLVLY